ncbi:MAG: response regulator [Candidatus Hydrothermarchaeaceae archaeon]
MDGKILVVDDDKVVRVTIANILSKVGYEVDSADSGKAAIEMTKAKKYDVILLDVILPDLNGIEILGEITRTSPSAEVVIITGFGTIEDAVRAVKIGAYDYVCKPFKKDEIHNLVKRALEERKLDEKFQKGSTMEEGVEIFTKMADSGFPTLCITTGDPKELQERYDVPGELIVKLDKLNEIMEAINRFIMVNKSAVVLLSGFENLLKKYPTKQLKEFIFEVSNSLTLNRARLIVAYDKASVDSKALENFAHEVSEVQLHPIFNIIASPIRRDLLLYLESQGKSIFTKMQQVLGVENAPNLSFHLRNLKNAGLVDEDSEKRYFLTDSGGEVCKLIKRFEITRVTKLENMVWTSVS